MTYVSALFFSILWGVFCAAFIRPWVLAFLLSAVGGYFMLDMLKLFGV